MPFRKQRRKNLLPAGRRHSSQTNRERNAKLSSKLGKKDSSRLAIELHSPYVLGRRRTDLTYLGLCSFFHLIWPYLKLPAAAAAAAIAGVVGAPAAAALVASNHSHLSDRPTEQLRLALAWPPLRERRCLNRPQRPRLSPDRSCVRRPVGQLGSAGFVRPVFRPTFKSEKKSPRTQWTLGWPQSAEEAGGLHAAVGS